MSLAQLFNCLSPVADAADLAPDACGHCTRLPAHRPRRARRRPGDRAGRHRLDQSRSGARRRSSAAAYRPFEGRRRVVIVDEADAMELSAQNALLKTLEEPPSASTFVLVTRRPDLLLPTVRSRCQRLRFAALGPADIATVLMRDHGFSEQDAHAAAAAGRRQYRPRARGGHRGLRRRARCRGRDAAAPSPQASNPAQRLAARQGAGARQGRSGRAGPAAAAGLVGAARSRRARCARRRAFAGERRLEAGSPAAAAVVRRASARFGRSPRSIRPCRRSIAMPARKSSPTGSRFRCRDFRS